MGECPSCQVDLEVEWRGGGGVRPVGTSTSCSMLHEYSFVGSRIGQSELWIHPGKEDEGYQP